MKNEAVSGPAAPKRVGEGGVDQVGLEVVGDGPAHHPARRQVDDGGQIQPAFPRVDVGDVAAPAGVDRRRIDGEVPADQVRPRRRVRVGNRGDLPPAWALAADPGGPHPTGDAFTAMSQASVGELGVDPRCSVGAVRRRVHLADLDGELLVDPFAGAALIAGVVGGPGDLQQLTRTFDAVLAGLLRGDERIHVHRVSLAKKAVARFRTSTSC
jgi:hypothetical protein